MSINFSELTTQHLNASGVPQVPAALQMTNSYAINDGPPGPPASTGPPSAYVTLVSSDGFEFHVRRSAACISGHIRRMLDSSMTEAINGRCVLEEISGMVLEKVVEYFYYNEKHRDSMGVPDMDIPSELCLELLMAADYLDT